MKHEWFDIDTGKWYPIEEVEVSPGLVLPARIQPFKPSKNQLIKYMKHKGHKIPFKKVKDERKQAETTEGKELVKLAKKHKDDKLYKTVLEYKGCESALSRYVDKWKPSEDGRVHGVYEYVPSSGQLNSKNPNCFSKDTEILTENGWIEFERLDKGIRLAQYDWQTGVINFELPLAYFENDFIGSLLHISTEQQIDLMVTGDHECLLQKRDGNFVKIYAGNYPEDHKQYHAGMYVGGNESYRDSQLTLIAALQADGHVFKPVIDKNGWKRSKGGHIKFGFTKDRKIQRLRQALKDENIEFSEHTAGQTVFYINRKNVPDWLKDKKFFGNWLLNLDRNALDFMAEEIWFWDGFAKGRTMYSSSVKENTDWVQIITLLSGRRAKIREYLTPKNVSNWQVDATDSEFSWTTNREIEKYPYAGKVYCVTMPKGTVIVRKNGKVAITGQCQNFVKHNIKDGVERKYAERLRGMIVAPPFHTLVELDFEAFHGVTTGFEARDKDYMRLAKMDMHSFVTAHFVHIMKLIPSSDLPDLKWSDSDLKAYLGTFKKRFAEIRDTQAKPAGLGYGFGMGANRLHQQNQETIPLKNAKILMQLLDDLFPVAKTWRNDIKILADRQGYLVSRFGFIRWFWDVFSRRYEDGNWIVTPGSDAEDAIAFLPSNDGHGHMQTTMVSLEDAGYNEEYGLINMIHDSLLYLMPDDKLDIGIQNVRQYMSKPSDILIDPIMAPNGLSFGVDVKVGKSWDKMTKY